MSDPIGYNGMFIPDEHIPPTDHREAPAPKGERAMSTERETAAGAREDLGHAFAEGRSRYDLRCM